MTDIGRDHARKIVDNANRTGNESDAVRSVNDQLENYIATNKERFPEICDQVRAEILKLSKGNIYLNDKNKDNDKLPDCLPDLELVDGNFVGKDLKSKTIEKLASGALQRFADGSAGTVLLSQYKKSLSNADYAEFIDKTADIIIDKSNKVANGNEISALANLEDFLEKFKANNDYKLLFDEVVSRSQAEGDSVPSLTRHTVNDRLIAVDLDKKTISKIAFQACEAYWSTGNDKPLTFMSAFLSDTDYSEFLEKTKSHLAQKGLELKTESYTLGTSERTRIVSLEKYVPPVGGQSPSHRDPLENMPAIFAMSEAGADVAWLSFLEARRTK
ncbi:MAG: hypothetical protein K2X77_20295 [Candidatus Obscuribacterales bacterium]|nr:hypothetical protein [Candidatus Obscuribacterales bacterium]